MEQGIEEARLEREAEKKAKEARLEREAEKKREAEKRAKEEKLEERKNLVKDMWTEVFKHIQFNTAMKLSTENSIFRDLFLIKLQKSKEFKKRLIAEYEKRLIAYIEAVYEWVQASRYASILQMPYIKDILRIFVEKYRDMDMEKYNEKDMEKMQFQIKENIKFVSIVFDNLNNKDELINIILTRFREIIVISPLNFLLKWVLYGMKMKDDISTFQRPNTPWATYLPELIEYINRYVLTDILLLYDDLKPEMEEYSVIFNEKDQEKYDKFIAQLLDSHQYGEQILSLQNSFSAMFNGGPLNIPPNFMQMFSSSANIITPSNVITPTPTSNQEFIICDNYINIPEDEYLDMSSEALVDKYRDECRRVLKLKLFKLSESMDEIDIRNLNIMEEACGEDLIKLCALFKLLQSKKKKDQKNKN